MWTCLKMFLVDSMQENVKAATGKGTCCAFWPSWGMMNTGFCVSHLMPGGAGQHSWTKVVPGLPTKWSQIRSYLLLPAYFSLAGLISASLHWAMPVCPPLQGAQACACSGPESQHPSVSPYLAAGAVIQFSNRPLHSASGGAQTWVLDHTVGSSVTWESHL